MKRLVISILLVAAAGAALYIAYLHRTPAMTSLPDGTVVYDVRTADEYAISHVTNAISLPLGALQHGTLPSTPKTQPVAVYGTSERTSSVAADILKKAGYSQVIDMQDLAGTANYGLSIVQ